MTSRFPPPPRVDPPDDRAFHDNRPGELGLLTEKTTPTSSDLIIIEDAAASNAKKRVQFGNIPTNALGGSWAAWVPTYANLTIGNGTVTARYTQIGKTIHCYFRFTLGSTSAVGTTPTVSTPVTASSSYTALRNVIGPSMHVEDGSATRMGGVRLNSTTTLNPFVHLASSTYSRLANLSATVPFTWGTSDILAFSATYEAA